MKSNIRSLYRQKLNKLRIENKYAEIGLIFFVMLLISIFFFMFRENNDVNRVIFFPEVTFASEIDEKIYSVEKRVLPYMSSLEENVELYVNELILGPIRPDHAEIIPKNTRLLSDFWPHGKVSDLYRLFREKDGFSERANVIVNEDGEIEFIRIYEIGELPDIIEILTFLREL